MNDLIRPALYQAEHTLESVLNDNRATRVQDVVGPVCESADTFAEQQHLPDWQCDDLIAIRSAGAYGFAMASNYNSRPRPAEILCDENRALLIRKRESLEDLWRGEQRLDAAAGEHGEAVP